MKRWKLAEPVPEGELAALGERPRVLASLLWRRGVRDEAAARAFFEPAWERDVHDPFLFADMRKAVGRILSAARSGEKIVVHGDYDADGVSAAAILHSTLSELGAAAEVYLPHREKEGYGFRPETAAALAAGGARLIITCDCGISDREAIGYAAARGIDVIVTDHHTLPPELPPAYAILHPLREGETYPFRHLTGGGVAFKLCQALWKEGGLPAGKEKWLLDLVAISTIADLGHLSGENRALVRFGLLVLGKARRLGLAKLMESARTDSRGLDAEAVAFQIAPRINAAGRMDHARGAFDLLTATDEPTAVELAEILNGHNAGRRSLTEKILLEAREAAAAGARKPAIVVAGDGWPAAICGLVAGKLADEFYRPAIVLGRDAEGRYVGSGRSIPEFDITAGLRAVSGSLARYGGHPRAAGLTIEGDGDYARFAEDFLSEAGRALVGHELEPKIDVEEEVALGEIDDELVEGLLKFEPHGEGNPRPLFLIRGARVAGLQAVGRDGRHLKMTITDDGGAHLGLIAFGFGDRLDEVAPGNAIDAVVELGFNEWNGRREVQGRVIDMRSA